MRVMVGSDKLKGHYLNKRFEFFGDKEHTLLAKLIFPWIEMVEITLKEENLTAKESFVFNKIKISYTSRRYLTYWSSQPENFCL